MSNKRIIKILEALSKAADVDLEFTDENPELEDNFDGVKEAGKKDMPKEKFDKAGGQGTPKKMNTDPKIDKVSDKGIEGGAKQKDSKTLKKEAYLIKMIQEMTGKKVVLKEYYEEPTAQPQGSDDRLATGKYLNNVRAALEKFEDAWTEISSLWDDAPFDLGEYLNDNYPFEHSFTEYNSAVTGWADSAIEKILDGYGDITNDQLSEDSRSEKIAKGKGTGNLLEDDEPIATSNKKEVSKEELQSRKNNSINSAKETIESLKQLIGKANRAIAAGESSTNSMSRAVSVFDQAKANIARCEKEKVEMENSPLEYWLNAGNGEFMSNGGPELDEASRAERVLRGKGTGNLKV